MIRDKLRHKLDVLRGVRDNEARVLYEDGAGVIIHDGVAAKVKVDTIDTVLALFEPLCELSDPTTEDH